MTLRNDEAQGFAYIQQGVDSKPGTQIAEFMFFLQQHGLHSAPAAIYMKKQQF